MYPNSDTETYTYDDLGNQTGIFMEGVQKYSAVYDLYGNLLSETDTVTGNTTRYYSDEYGYSGIAFVFNVSGNIVYETLSSSDAMFEEKTDALGRSVKNTLTANEATIFIRNFTYTTDTGNQSSYQISGETFSDGTAELNIAYNYEYDALGNLTKIKEDGTIYITYTYDSLSQLVREDNAYAGKSYTYTYDGNGNITSKKTYAYTTGTLGTVLDTITYGYTDSNWKDKMTSYDGMSISYDASGNPLNWTDYRELTWVGRQLDSIMSPDGAMWTFKYDHNGLRTEREYSYYGDVILNTKYTWVDEKLVSEYRSGGMLSTPITLEYYYDGEELIGFNYNGTDYYYGKTNNGEIRYIYDTNGNIVTTYLYDAWGAPISTTGSLASTVGAINLFRYKSYYYDAETDLYYLQSRCYDPQVGRFLNADAVDFLGVTETVLSFNLFAYCENNPIRYNDKTGTASYVIFDNTMYSYMWANSRSGGFVSLSQAAAKTPRLVSLGNTSFYNTVEEAVKAWAIYNIAATKQDHRERGAIIYRRNINGKIKYYTGQTRVGYNLHCINAFLLGYLEYPSQKNNVVGFIHTHTAYPKENSRWNPIDYGPSRQDLKLFKWYGIIRQFIGNELGQLYEFDLYGNQRFIW